MLPGKNLLAVMANVASKQALPRPCSQGALSSSWTVTKIIVWQEQIIIRIQYLYEWLTLPVHCTGAVQRRLSGLEHIPLVARTALEVFGMS